MTAGPAVVYLSGGVGGARLLHGLVQVVPRGSLTAIVNTGDDFRHWGLWVCPDLDTVMYTLAELGDERRGWGLAGETFRAKAMMERYGAPGWFALGDADLATHLVRSDALARGDRLTQVTARLCADLGVACPVLPMCDAPRCTWIHTDEGVSLPFQRWFVERRAEPRVTSVGYEGASGASPEVYGALERADLIVIGPSNPYVSIDPILTLDGVRAVLSRKRVVAVSPIVAGRAVKGPLGGMLRSIAGREPSPGAIVEHYGSLLSGIVLETGDEGAVGDFPLHATATVMGGKDDRRRLAEEVLRFAGGLA